MATLLRRSHRQPLVALLSGWKTTSKGNHWGFESDWAVLETTHLAAAFTHGLPLGEFARDLGLARGIQGVGHNKAIKDLGAFFTAAGVPADPRLEQRFTEGWIAATETTPPKFCNDALTGLQTHEHLSRILHDLCSDANFASDAFIIGKLRMPSLPEGATLRWTMLAELGRCCQEAFKDSGATLSYHQSTVNVLMRRSNANYARMVACHSSLTRITHFPWDPDEITYKRLHVP